VIQPPNATVCCVRQTGLTWIPISAGVYRGACVTGSPGIKDDLVNAGAIWEDKPVVIDHHFVSSRKPDDLPDFCRGMLSVLLRRNEG